MSESSIIRTKVWSELINVALPDSRFHYNFSEYIPDFKGSAIATDRLVALDAYKNSKFAFITPDNCLVDLRYRMIGAGIPFVMSTYGIYRGFLLMEPGMVPPGAELCAAWLDGMEHYGAPISLTEIKKRGNFDFMVTGASAVSHEGVRFGKGHGFFDLEWGMFTDIGAADEHTAVAALVHDCQFVNDELQPTQTDILVDVVATPAQLHSVNSRAKRPSGIKWDLLTPEQIECTPPLIELKNMLGVT